VPVAIGRWDKWRQLLPVFSKFKLLSNHSRRQQRFKFVFKMLFHFYLLKLFPQHFDQFTGLSQPKPIGDRDCVWVRKTDRLTITKRTATTTTTTAAAATTTTAHTHHHHHYYYYYYYCASVLWLVCVVWRRHWPVSEQRVYRAPDWWQWFWSCRRSVCLQMTLPT